MTGIVATQGIHINKSLAGSRTKSFPRAVVRRPQFVVSRKVRAMADPEWATPALELAKLAGPIVTIALFGFNQNRQIGRIEARQEAFEKALARQEAATEKGFAKQAAALAEAMTLLRDDMKDGFKRQDAAVNSLRDDMKEGFKKQDAASTLLQKDVGELKSEFIYLKGFKEGKEEEDKKSRLVLK
jgi:hypothetical protein